ncbi:unnamed protein product [Agarophyton chilense]
MPAFAYDDNSALSARAHHTLQLQAPPLAPPVPVPQYPHGAPHAAFAAPPAEYATAITQPLPFSDAQLRYQCSHLAYQHAACSLQPPPHQNAHYYYCKSASEVAHAQQPASPAQPPLRHAPPRTANERAQSRAAAAPQCVDTKHHGDQLALVASQPRREQGATVHSLPPRSFDANHVTHSVGADGAKPPSPSQNHSSDEAALMRAALNHAACSATTPSRAEHRAANHVSDPPNQLTSGSATKSTVSVADKRAASELASASAAPLSPAPLRQRSALDECNRPKLPLLASNSVVQPPHEQLQFVQSGGLRAWIMLNVSPRKRFHGSMFVDMPYRSYFSGAVRVMYDDSRSLRVVAFSKFECVTSHDVLRQWWVSNRSHFSLAPEHFPDEQTLTTLCLAKRC